MVLVALVAAATSIAGIEDLVLAHPGDFEILRLQHALAPADEAGTSWRGHLVGGVSGYGDEDEAGFGVIGAEFASGTTENVRLSGFGGIVEGDLSSWLAGGAIEGRRTLGSRSLLHFRGSYAYQERFGDDPFDSIDDDFRFIVPIPGTEIRPPGEAEVVLDDVAWGRYRVDVSFVRTLTQSGRGRTAVLLESGAHLTHARFEGVNDATLNLEISYPPGTYRTTESEYVWSAPIGAFLAWRGGRMGAALGARSDVTFESLVGLIGMTVTI